MLITKAKDRHLRGKRIEGIVFFVFVEDIEKVRFEVSR